jgi:hypothetical protein
MYYYYYHGEKWLDSEMYAPDMMNEDGKPDLRRARLSTVEEPVQRQSTPAHSDEDYADFESGYFQSRIKASAKKKAGRAGGLVTVSGKG